MACSATGGLLSLSPELILEITSHIVSWDDFRAGRRDLTTLSECSIMFGQDTLANLRLVCRYLSEVLECEIFKSLTFDFYIANRHSSHIDHVESQLELLAQSGNPASKHAMFLYLKCLDPFPVEEYDPHCSTQEADLDLRNLIETAILSFQHLRSVVWNIEYDNEQSTRVINVLSTLPSLEDLTLQIGPYCRDPTRLSLNKFHDLSSLAISLTKFPPDGADESDEHQEHVEDHISQIIAQSPMLRYLTILQPDPLNFLSVYDLSLPNLLKKVPAAQPLAHLEFLHFALENMRIDKNTLPHLKALKVLRVEGSAGSDCSGADIWRPLTMAQIKLREITVVHFSEPLAEYLASYSGLKKLHVLLTYYDSEFTRCDVRAFVRDVLPLHGPPSTINSARSGHDLQQSSQDGLIFEIDTQKQSLSTKVPSLSVTICIDSIPKALPVVLECVTRSSICYTERLEISYSPTTTYFGCGHGMRQHYRSNSAAGKIWLSDLKVEDFQRYPPIISLKHEVFELRQCEDRVGLYEYQLLPRTEGLNYGSDSYYYD